MIIPKNTFISKLILLLGFLMVYKPIQADNALKPTSKEILETAVSKTAKDLLVPGAFVLLSTPQGDYQLSYGTTKQGVEIAPTSNTYFRIASLTKTMMAAVILQQAQEGKLRLNEPIANYLAKVPNGKNITIADLLSMRSGLYNYTNSAKLAAILDKNPDKAWSPQEVLAIAFNHPPYFKPNAAYNYSNTNYVLLGLLAEKLDQKPLAQIFQQRLFQPLNMKNTFLPANTATSLPEPFAHGYQYGGSAYALIDKAYPAKMQAAAKTGTLKARDYTFLNPSYASAAGGVVSTAGDLAIWIKALAGGKVFNAEYQKLWLDSVKPEDPDNKLGQQYGFGIAQLPLGPNKIYFHGGEQPGYNSFIGFDLANNITLVVWTNLSVSIDGAPTANSIMLQVLDRLYAVSPLRP